MIDNQQFIFRARNIIESAINSGLSVRQTVKWMTEANIPDDIMLEIIVKNSKKFKSSESRKLESPEIKHIIHKEQLQRIMRMKHRETYFDKED